MKLSGKSKGEWGYINDRRIRVTVITVFMYACAIGIYFLGLKITGTSRNLFTVVAVLGILPASKSLVNMIMFLRFSSLGSERYKKYDEASGDVPLIYELAFTTYEKTYFVEAIACVGNTVAGCYLGKTSKGRSHNDDMKALKEHIETVLTNDGHKGFVVKIYDDPDDFIRRVAEMNGISTEDAGKSDSSILSTLKAVCL